MKLPLYQVDAFARAGAPFTGNPAAVCPLAVDSPLDDATMQAIAAENNLSETAFFVRANDGDRYDIRWFTPASEVDLCGHATLASAYVLMQHIDRGRERVTFSTRKAGDLVVTRDGELFSMLFPSRPPSPIDAGSPEMTALADALGARPRELHAARDYVAVFDSDAAVCALAPDMTKLAALDRYGVIVTGPGTVGDGCDFVSRFFAPKLGIPEDPVTGSAHCTLIPFWAKRLGKTRLSAIQRSKRTGQLACEDRGAHVTMAGRAVLYMTGSIHL